MTSDPPAPSYLEALLIAMRTAGNRLATVSGYLVSAEKAQVPAWKWQLLTAARTAIFEAYASLDDAEEKLYRLGAPARLPAPLDALPPRIAAMRADLGAAESLLDEALSDAASNAIGEA